jgi:RNA polymerase sigma factor (sigma-70 family)
MAVDLDVLYRELASRLEQIVRRDVRAPDAVIEDACQFAWSRLVHHAHRVHRDCALAWLVKTAVHEAFKLIRRDGRELSLDAGPAGEPWLAALATVPEPYDLLEQRLRLDMLDVLPKRQRQMLWLHALGHSYAEISHHTGASQRTVERQLLRAKRSARALAAA